MDLKNKIRIDTCTHKTVPHKYIPYITRLSHQNQQHIAILMTMDHSPDQKILWKMRLKFIELLNLLHLPFLRKSKWSNHSTECPLKC